MLVAAFSVVAFLHWTPFINDQDNRLAISAQCCIFLTLFYALLTKSGIEEEDNYDKTVFGVLLVVINSLVVFLVLFEALGKPIQNLIRKLGRKHLHNAALRGLTSVHEDWQVFYGYWQDLITSDETSAGWELLKVKDWGGKQSSALNWLEETGAVGQ